MMKQQQDSEVKQTAVLLADFRTLCGHTPELPLEPPLTKSQTIKYQKWFAQSDILSPQDCIALMNDANYLEDQPILNLLTAQCAWWRHTSHVGPELQPLLETLPIELQCLIDDWIPITSMPPLVKLSDRRNEREQWLRQQYPDVEIDFKSKTDEVLLDLQLDTMALQHMRHCLQSARELLFLAISAYANDLQLDLHFLRLANRELAFPHQIIHQHWMRQQYDTGKALMTEMKLSLDSIAMTVTDHFNPVLLWTPAFESLLPNASLTDTFIESACARRSHLSQVRKLQSHVQQIHIDKAARYGFVWLVDVLALACGLEEAPLTIQAIGIFEQEKNANVVLAYFEEQLKNKTHEVVTEMLMAVIDIDFGTPSTRQSLIKWMLDHEFIPHNVVLRNKLEAEQWEFQSEL
jgi:hypothetical protein